MKKDYDHKKIEKKWQGIWAKKKIYKTPDNSKKKKFYILDMFPYVSGEGLHVGHPKGYIATDVVSRMKRMQGFNVLHPMGFDAFGLPAENYAIKTKTNPVVSVKKNINRFKKQLDVIGFDYDWDRIVNTSDPKFYKWTQWIFLKLLEKGLAFESNEPVNWCPTDKTVLANEDVEDGKCERCGTVVEKKPIRQWVLKITDYADRLLSDLDELDWPESIKESQRNWIGKSEGAEIDFVVRQDLTIKVFTTRPDTIFGATFIAIAPEVAKRLTGKDFGIKSDTDRENKEKIGADTGLVAKNPANGEMIPVWVVNYVSAEYGTGAIMGVPADDERDFVFAEKYNLPIVKDYPKANFEDFGKKVIRYKLRDWVFSRQRYWGEPIPVLRDGDEVVPLKEKDLPLELPKVKSYEPTGTAESPLAGLSNWMNVKVGKKILRRESNTMPQWAGSSWYYLRYMDPKNNKALVDKKKEEYWNMVDLYVGGAEHATRHLIYARFWHKFLYDIGVVADKEPFKRLQHVGLIIASDGRKMSKRFGNIISPETIISTFGADSLRTYEMFMGPFDQSVAWSTNGIVGPYRFLEKVWKLREKISKSSHFSILKILNKTIKKVTEDIEAMRFNTAISAMMILGTEMERAPNISKDDYKKFLQILSPFAPHITEELWNMIGDPEGKSTSYGAGKKSIHLSEWPKWDESLIVDTEVKIMIQINGKVRSEIMTSVDASEEDVKKQALADAVVLKYTSGQEIKKVIYVKGRLINIVI